jgi:cytolysin-activating lysine-acyltransferase
MSFTSAPEATTGKTVSQVLGEIAWLMTQSPLHKQMFLGDLEWFAMPPILMEQFRIWNGANPTGGPPIPSAVAFWAFVSPDTDARLEAGAYKLAPQEWQGGDIPWLIELIAPFGAQDEIIADLQQNVFGAEGFKFHMTGPDGVRRVVKSREAGVQ